MNPPGVEHAYVAWLELDANRPGGKRRVSERSLEQLSLLRRIGAQVRPGDVLEVVVVGERDPKAEERRLFSMSASRNSAVTIERD